MKSTHRWTLSALLLPALVLMPLTQALAANEDAPIRPSCEGTYQGMPIGKIANRYACSNQQLILQAALPELNWGQPIGKLIEKALRQSQLPQVQAQPETPATANWSFPAQKRVKAPNSTKSTK